MIIETILIKYIKSESRILEIKVELSLLLY